MSTIVSKKKETHKNIDEPLDYNPIYKINYLVNGSINTIFVFYGQPIKVQNEEQILQTIFTEKEVDHITKNKIVVKDVFLNISIPFLYLKRWVGAPTVCRH